MSKEKRSSDFNGQHNGTKRRKVDTPATANGKENTVAGMYNVNSSKEAHAKQRVLSKERKASKPNADSTQRAKKLWERLRRKSHVAKDERDQLVAELFAIITGNVKDFVFKHDSVRVIQCAIKYANAQQRKSIAKELKGGFRQLAESRYAKFLIAKLLVTNDEEIRKMIMNEFRGHVKKLINHPEGSWILDDSYRQIATKDEKAMLLREWYGPEFALFQDSRETVSASLPDILAANPEKRKPIMEHLFGMINQLVQKRMTGFTMLHDAMYQYSLALKRPSKSEESAEFMNLLTDSTDDEGDLLKNLAFTESGSKLVARALAVGTAKDRKNILRVYKEHIEALAYDPHGVNVIIAAYESVDDTVMVSKLILPELLGAKKPSVEERYDAVFTAATNLTARRALLYPLATTSSLAITDRTEIPQPPKWLVAPGSTCWAVIKDVHELRVETSKKDPALRLRELARSTCTMADGALLSTIAHRTNSLITSSFGSQFVTELLLRVPSSLGGSPDDEALREEKEAAMQAVANLASGSPSSPRPLKSTVPSPTQEQQNGEESKDGEMLHPCQDPAAGRMFKRLSLSMSMNPATKKLEALPEPIGFAKHLAKAISPWIVEWATGPSSFVVANLLDEKDFATTEPDLRKQLVATLSKGESKKKLKQAGEAGGNKGALLVLERL